MKGGRENRIKVKLTSLRRALHPRVSVRFIGRADAESDEALHRAERVLAALGGPAGVHQGAGADTATADRSVTSVVRRCGTPCTSNSSLQRCYCLMPERISGAAGLALAVVPAHQVAAVGVGAAGRSLALVPVRLALHVGVADVVLRAAAPLLVVRHPALGVGPAGVLQLAGVGAAAGRAGLVRLAVPAGATLDTPTLLPRVALQREQLRYRLLICKKEGIS